MSRDSSVAETFRGMSEYTKRARAGRREDAPINLAAAGIEYSSHNDGAHLILSVAGERIDYWPGTNKWRRGGKYHKGDIVALLEFIRRIVTK